MGHVGIREYDLIDFVITDQLLQIALRVDGNALRVERARQRRRIAAAVDIGDLRGGEGDDACAFVLAKDSVEIVKIAAGGAGDHDAHGTVGIHRGSLLHEGIWLTVPMGMRRVAGCPQPARSPMLSGNWQTGI